MVGRIGKLSGTHLGSVLNGGWTAHVVVKRGLVATAKRMAYIDEHARRVHSSHQVLVKRGVEALSGEIPVRRPRPDKQVLSRGKPANNKPALKPLEISTKSAAPCYDQMDLVHYFKDKVLPTYCFDDLGDNLALRTIHDHLLFKFGIDVPLLKHESTKELQALYKLVNERLVTDNEVHRVLFFEDFGILKQYDGLKPAKKPAKVKIGIHPDTLNELEHVVNKLVASDKPSELSEEYRKLSLLAKDIVEAPKEQPADVDVESLSDFLNKAQNNKRTREDFLFRKQKQYEWNKKVAGPKVGFFAPPAPRRRMKLSFTSDSSLIDPVVGNGEYEYLVYDIAADSKLITVKNPSYQKKDLFTILNSKKNPELILDIMNKYESNGGWKLIGDINDNHLLFQRSASHDKSKSSKTRILYLLGGSATALGVMAFLQTR